MIPLNSIVDRKFSWRLNAACLIHLLVMHHDFRSGASLEKISAGRSDGPGLSRWSLSSGKVNASSS